MKNIFIKILENPLLKLFVFGAIVLFTGLLLPDYDSYLEPIGLGLLIGVATSHLIIKKMDTALGSIFDSEKLLTKSRHNN